MVNDKIKFYESHYVYHMDFMNGSLQIPKVYGAYNIATGCGSGKTTVIKQIIEQKYNEGVIVFCKTIAECNELYDHAVQVAYESNGNLKINEIINLCSEPRMEKIGKLMICTNGVDLNWKDNLDLISKKKVVIATHFVLVNTEINYLTRLSNVPTKADIISEGLCGVVYEVPIRKFILIDELPLIDPIQGKFRVIDLLYLLKRTDLLVPDPDSKEVKKDFRMDIEPTTYQGFLNKYDMLCSIDPKLKIGSDNELGRSRYNMMLSLMYKNNNLGNRVTNSLKSGEKDPYITFRYNLFSMVLSAGQYINTNIWLFDGTGDITLAGLSKPSTQSNQYSPTFRFMSYPNKYKNEEVDIIKIPNYLKSRSIDVDKMFNKKDEVLDNLNKNIDLLEMIIRCNKETLIIVWKNLKSKFITEDKNYTENLSKYVLNDEFNLPDYYKSRLEGRLVGTDHKFHIIHYGSGLDLATNEFRNCDSIVRLGLYQIPRYALKEYNEILCTDLSESEFILYQNVQSLSRTHIRKHQGKKVRFYISEDFGEYIDDLKTYLNNEGCNCRLLNRSIESIEKRLRNKILYLIDRIPEIKYNIMSSELKKFNININDLFSIIPVSKKESSRYNKLADELYNLGVKLNIITNDWNK